MYFINNNSLQGTCEIAFSRGVLYRCVFLELPVVSIFFTSCVASLRPVWMSTVHYMSPYNTYISGK